MVKVSGCRPSQVAGLGTGRRTESNSPLGANHDHDRPRDPAIDLRRPRHRPTRSSRETARAGETKALPTTHAARGRWAWKETQVAEVKKLLTAPPPPIPLWPRSLSQRRKLQQRKLSRRSRFFVKRARRRRRNKARCISTTSPASAGLFVREEMSANWFPRSLVL
jgi:hypothetical protein